MATIRTNLSGTVIAVNAEGDQLSLKAGDTIPTGFWVAGGAVQGGDASDVRPPWYRNPVPTPQVSWADVSGKPAVIAAGADAAAARSVIGAGTSNLALGTTASTALAGNGKAASASAADKLATARTVALTGAVTGTGSFDGSANLSITTTDGA